MVGVVRYSLVVWCGVSTASRTGCVGRDEENLAAVYSTDQIEFDTTDIRNWHNVHSYYNDNHCLNVMVVNLVGWSFL